MPRNLVEVQSRLERVLKQHSCSKVVHVDAHLRAHHATAVVQRIDRERTTYCWAQGLPSPMRFRVATNAWPHGDSIKALSESPPSLHSRRRVFLVGGLFDRPSPRLDQLLRKDPRRQPSRLKAFLQLSQE